MLNTLLFLEINDENNIVPALKEFRFRKGKQAREVTLILLNC